MRSGRGTARQVEPSCLRSGGHPEQLNLQDRSGQAKPYQLRQIVALVRRYDLRIEDDQ